MFYKLMCMIIISNLCPGISYASLSKFYTQEEIQEARDKGNSNVNLKDHKLSGQNTWLSLREENYTYKELSYEKYTLVRIDYRSELNDWYGEIALFPISNSSLKEIYRTKQGFNDMLGTAYDSVIAFNYIPGKAETNQKPYVILVKSNAGYNQGGKGYNQFTRKCLINFVKRHTDAELIISDARNPISQHILKKPEFGFRSGINNKDLALYIKGMAVPYYLSIDRSS